MQRLPDGSGFFVGLVGGPRGKGLIPWLKYDTRNRARRWLFVYRMYRDAYRISREPGQGPPLARWRSLLYALRCP